MLVDLCVHSISAALHDQQGSGSAVAVHVTHASHSLSVLDSASAQVTVEA
jgi:hypothetical protein